MKRKSIYLFLIVCCFSMISSARQRYSNPCVDNAAGVVKANTCAGENADKTATGYDMSPVGFFVLNM